MGKRRILEKLTVTVAPCYNFINEDGVMEKRTAIIAPIKLQEAEDYSVLISYACNLSESCQNVDCRYSKAWREKEEKH